MFEIPIHSAPPLRGRRSVPSPEAAQPRNSSRGAKNSKASSSRNSNGVHRGVGFLSARGSPYRAPSDGAASLTRVAEGSDSELSNVGTILLNTAMKTNGRTRITSATTIPSFPKSSGA